MMTSANTNAGLGRRKFIKGASIVGGSLMTAGLVAGPRISLAESASGGTTAAAASDRRRTSNQLTRREEEVLSLIDEDEVASVLQDFVRIPTAMANEQAGATYFAERLREWGMNDVLIQGIEGHPGRSNLIARLPGSTPKGPTLMTTSHIDSIVPEGLAGEEWFADPYSGLIQNGRVYGIGASDNKSGCVAKIMAAKAIHEAGLELPGDLLTVLVADEEGYMLGIKEFIKAGLHKEVSGAYGEGVGTSPYQGETRGGRTMAIITFHGTNFHAGTSAGRPGVVNAIHKAGKFIAAIDANRWPDHPADPHYGRTFYQISMVQGGWPDTTQTSQKPASCRLFFDARMVPDHDPDDVWKDVQGILDRLAREDKEFKYTIGEIDRRPGYRRNPEWPVVKAAASAYEGLAGKPAKFGDVKRDQFSIGTTDTHYLIKEGIPCASIISETPRDAQAHQPNEYISTKMLAGGTRATALTIMRYWDFVGG